MRAPLLHRNPGAAPAVSDAVAPDGVRPPDTGHDTARDAGHDAGHPAYRPDIDGLRAVAVLSVVGYHAFPGTVRGGFVGVDIFFVISGFLISTILFGSLARGTFSLGDFYARRVRRIFPALLVVLVATFAFGWFALMADEYRQLGKHLAAGAGFVSNLVSWHESGYFDAAADAKPFLHLWSLGVEEQFYIVWPVMLLATWRLRRNPLVVTALALLASFVLNVVLAGADPVADFYSPLARFWELSAGSLLAWTAQGKAGKATAFFARHRDVLSFAGAGALVAGLATVRSGDGFPGWWALLPVGGTVLLIAAGAGAWLNRRVLSHRFAVGIGLVSYPLYLWHWPILSLIRILDAERPGRLTRAAALMVALVLAWLTWRCVERPLRRLHAGRLGATPGAAPGTAPGKTRVEARGATEPAATVDTGVATTVRIPLVAAMIVVGLAGIAAYASGGFASRDAARLPVLTPGDLTPEAFFAYGRQHFAPCEPASLRDDAERWDGIVRCLQSRAGPADLALVGDSHAEHLFPGLAEALPSRNVVYYLRSALPVTSNPSFDAIFATVLADRRIRTVVIAAWWGLRLEQVRDATAEQALSRTVEALLRAGKQVYLVDDTPNFSFSPRLCKYAGGFFRRHRCSEDASFFGKESRSYAALLMALEQRFPALRIVRPAPAFCTQTACSMEAGGKLLLRDSDHLSIEGSQYVGRRIVEDHPELRSPARAAS